MNKKLMSIVLAVALVMTMVAIAIPAVMALDGPVTLSITPDKTEVKPGDTVNYTVSFGAVEDLAMIEMSLDIPAGLNYVSGAAVATAETLNCANASYNDAAKKFGSYGGHYTSSDSTDLITFSVTVSDTASEGDEFKVNIKSGYTFGSDEEDFDLDIQNPAVVVVGDPVETEPVETEPVETEPVETEPVETEPVETEPVETEPVETEPVETEPVETTPATETPATEAGEETTPATTIAPTDAPSTTGGGTSTNDESTTPNANVVKTGSTVWFAVILLLVAVSAAGVLFYYKKRRQ